MSAEIDVKQDGALLRVTLNRPDDGNRMSDPMAKELGEIISNPADSVRVILLTGAGNDFCLGRTLMSPTSGAAAPEALALRKRNEVVFNTYGSFRRSPLPVIAAVQGKALGFGCALAAVADITLAADDAQFSFPETAHRIMPTMAMSSMVDRVAIKPLMYMFYSADLLTAQEALGIGLVSKVAANSSLHATVESLCVKMLEIAPPALYAVKEYARAARTMDSQGANDFARNLHATINSSSEMRGR
jgi:enoyl-CoA hydratase